VVERRPPEERAGRKRKRQEIDFAPCCSLHWAAMWAAAPAAHV
jgi:hypothetical protein